MTEKEYELAIQHNYAIGSKLRIIKFKDLLTDEDKLDIINALITFENSHIIANGFNDMQTAWALKEELEAALDT